MNTEISYPVIDNDPNSPDYGTVFEVLGTESCERRWGPGTRVHLRNCKTGQVFDLWVGTFVTIRDFRALPLDQVSQDRKDARDSEVGYLIKNMQTGTTYRVLGTGPTANAPHLTAVWVQKVGEQGATRWSPDMLVSNFHDIVAVDSDGNPQTREPVAAPVADGFKALDTTAKSLASADARSDLGDKLAQKWSAPLTEPRKSVPNPLAFPQRTAPGTFNITLPKVSDREPVRDYLVRYVLVGEVDGLGEVCDYCPVGRKINCNVYVTPNSPDSDTYAQCCEECALHVVDGVLDTDPAHVVTIERAV